MPNTDSDLGVSLLSDAPKKPLPSHFCFGFQSSVPFSSNLWEGNSLLPKTLSTSLLSIEIEDDIKTVLKLLRWYKTPLPRPKLPCVFLLSEDSRIALANRKKFLFSSSSSPTSPLAP